MASVFLSYDRDDGDKAKRLALALEKAGHEVWWDLHVRGGAQFSKVIEEALKAADAVVVLWSRHSIESPWVRDEAAAGRDSGRLVPATLDGTEPPLGFRQFQTIDLSGWQGRRKPEQLRILLDDIADVSKSRAPPAAEDPLPATVAPPKAERIGSAVRWPILSAVGLLVIVALAVVAWKLIDRPPSVPVVAVIAADSSAASQAIARDLLVKLGTLQASQSESIDLVNGNDKTKKPVLIFQVTGQPGRANLALTETRNRSLLWAKEFGDSNGNEANLRQQLAFTATHALRCAIEAMDPAAGRLSRQSVKIYVNACATIPNAAPADITALLSPLQKLVQDAPRFAGAWSQLLLAEIAAATNPTNPDADALWPVLTGHIRQARQLHPDIAETYIAEYVMIPDAQFLRRSQILDRGIELNPESSELRYERQYFHQSVGRMEDALQDARRGMELDPLSPTMREGYIMALAFAGRLDEAFSELKQAEQLWPGATSLSQARYTLHLRAGDPREALRLLRGGVLRQTRTDWMRVQEALLEARIDPSPEKVNQALRTARGTYDVLPPAISLLSQTLVELDREEELFPVLLNWRRMDIVSFVTDVLFRPKFADFHKDPRFIQVAKRLGLLDYWRAAGKWPDFCSRADLPYDCQEEAAKLRD